jgi:membrane-associated phospholipid phosphatase
MTDVLGGYALGAAWVSLVIAVAIIIGRRPLHEVDGPDRRGGGWRGRRRRRRALERQLAV